MSYIEIDSEEKEFEPYGDYSEVVSMLRSRPPIRSRRARRKKRLTLIQILINLIESSLFKAFMISFISIIIWGNKDQLYSKASALGNSTSTNINSTLELTIKNFNSISDNLITAIVKFKKDQKKPLSIISKILLGYSSFLVSKKIGTIISNLYVDPDLQLHKLETKFNFLLEETQHTENSEEGKLDIPISSGNKEYVSDSDKNSSYIQLSPASSPEISFTDKKPNSEKYNFKISKIKKETKKTLATNSQLQTSLEEELLQEKDFTVINQ